MHSTKIDKASEAILSRIMAKTVHIPDTVDEWIWTAWDIGQIACVPLRLESSVRGRLVPSTRGWAILYNDTLPEVLQILVFAHELSEYLSRSGQSELFGSIDFDSTTVDYHHRVAIATTRKVAHILGLHYEALVNSKLPYNS